MSMWISVEQLDGETLELEVTAEMTMREVKRQIKDGKMWVDELSRDTTVVELILGDKKVMNDETVAELGLSEGSKLTAVFRQNVARCSNQSAFGPDLDPDALVIVEIPDSETEVVAWAFHECPRLAKVVIPSSVTRIGHLAFYSCSSLLEVTIPDSVAEIGRLTFAHCRSLRSVDPPDFVLEADRNAFYGCSSLISGAEPDSVTHIGGGAPSKAADW